MSSQNSGPRDRDGGEGKPNEGNNEVGEGGSAALLSHPPTSKIYGSEEAREQAVASLQALLWDKVIGKPSTDFKYIVAEGRVATLSTANSDGEINPSKASEELSRLLESKKDMYVHVHVTLPRCSLNNQGMIEILEGLEGHPKARLSSLAVSGNKLTDEFTSWLSREVQADSNRAFAAVKEIDVSYNYLTAVGVDALTRALPDLRRLDVRMNMIENTGLFRGDRSIEISPQRMDREGMEEMQAAGVDNKFSPPPPPPPPPQPTESNGDDGPTNVSSLLQSFRQIATSGDNTPENVSQELLKLQSSRSKLYGNADDANRLGDNLMAAFRLTSDNNPNSTGPQTAPLSTPQGLSGIFPPPTESAPPAAPTRAPAGRPRFSPNDVAALAQSQLSRSGQARLDLGHPPARDPFAAYAAQAGGRLPKSGGSLTHVPTESSRAVSEVQSLIARLEANDRGKQQQQKRDNASLMRELVVQLTALQASINRNQTNAAQQNSGGATQHQQQRKEEQGRGQSEPTVSDLLDALRKFLDAHKAEAGGPSQASTGQASGQQQQQAAYGNSGGQSKGQRMTVAEMEQNLFNTLRKNDQAPQQSFTGSSTSIANRIINVPLRVVPRSEVTKYDQRVVVPEENPGRPSELVCGLDLQSTSRGYLVLYISPFPGQQHLQQGDTILAINGVGLVPKTNSDAKHIRTAFGRNLFDGVLCTVLRTAEGREQIAAYRSMNVTRRLYIEGLLQATGVTWKELVNSGMTSDPDVAVGEMAARKGCRGVLLRVSTDTAAPMVSLHGDRESVEQVTEQVTELITVLAKRVRDEKTNKEAAAQAAAELKAAVLARANAGAPTSNTAKQEPTASENDSSPASAAKPDESGDARPSDTNSEKDGMKAEEKEPEPGDKKEDLADDSEGAEFTSAKESEAGSL
ncbi:hypothetical protein FOL46_007525 [Perkinsus olseni]|uniref:PDZ domain-containing protein n=1 Tax=Perkinsus olseni TaxID=32597 RepID=A0A7J6LD47_PEROL|nr:hypothetical protein FOL46_007525 [Perkinsus olseni]